MDDQDAELFGHVIPKWLVPIEQNIVLHEGMDEDETIRLVPAQDGWATIEVRRRGRTIVKTRIVLYSRY